MARQFLCTVNTTFPTRRTADILHLAKVQKGARTHVALSHISHGWLAEHGHLVDVVVVKISTRADWERAKEAVLEAKHRGISVAVQTRFEKGRVYPIADIVAWFVPDFWEVFLGEADDMADFFNKNGRWAEQVTDVRVECVQSRAVNRLHYRYLDD